MRKKRRIFWGLLVLLYYISAIVAVPQIIYYDELDRITSTRRDAAIVASDALNLERQSYLNSLETFHDCLKPSEHDLHFFKHVMVEKKENGDANFVCKMGRRTYEGPDLMFTYDDCVNLPPHPRRGPYEDYELMSKDSIKKICIYDYAITEEIKSLMLSHNSNNARIKTFIIISPEELPADQHVWYQEELMRLKYVQ